MWKLINSRSLGSVDILDYVILSEARAKNLRVVWPVLVRSPEILRHCVPQNDMPVKCQHSLVHRDVNGSIVRSNDFSRFWAG